MHFLPTKYSSEEWHKSRVSSCAEENRICGRPFMIESQVFHNETYYRYLLYSEVKIDRYVGGRKMEKEERKVRWGGGGEKE